MRKTHIGKQQCSTLFWVSVFSIVLFGIGAYRHLGLGVHTPETTLFGDTGDGLFNLWILEHVLQNIFSGPSALNNGRIFYPDHLQTLWWSDNLIAFTPVYGFLKLAFFMESIEAYWWTTLLFSFLGYGLIIWMLAELWQSQPRAPALLTSGSICLLPLVAYALFFTIPRLARYPHFQHLAICFLTLLFISCIRFFRNRSKTNVALILMAFLLLVYSAPYYAIIGGLILLLFGALVLAEGRTPPIKLFLDNKVALLVFALLLIYPARQYLSVPHQAHSRYILSLSSVQPTNLFIPDVDWISTAITSLLPSEYLPSNEYGYLGTGILIAGMSAILWLVVHYRFTILRLMKQPVWIALLLTTVFTMVDAKEIKWFTCYLRAGLPLFLLLVLAFNWRKNPPSPYVLSLIFLAGSAVIILGTAMGPSGMDHLFYYNNFHPTVWNILADWIPGYASMRKLSRFALPGQMLVGIIAFSILLSARTHVSIRVQKFVLLMILSLVALQIIETKRYEVRKTSIAPETLRLPNSIAESVVYLEGEILVLPAAPFHRNPERIIKWVPYPKVHLLNGYSGRSTQTFDHIMELESTHGPGSIEQIYAAIKAGADYLFLEVKHMPPETTALLKSQYQTMATDKDYLLLSLTISTSG